MRLPIVLFLSVAALVSAQDPAADREIVLPRAPQISPDGNQIAFAWRGDVWTAPVQGGEARRVTSHPGDDDSPAFSPDGKRIAFTSDRAGGTQVFVVDLPGGAPRQLTSDSRGKSLLGFARDGSLLLAMSSDEHFHGSESRRLYRLDLDGKMPKRLVLDVGFSSAALSPDGTKVLFTRGRSAWWRKGYRGAAAEQLWLAELGDGSGEPELTRLSTDRPEFQNVTESDPMWAPDGKTYWYVSDPDGTFDVYQRTLGDGAARRVTNVGAEDGSDDGVAFPSVSADGRSMVVRRRFHLLHVDVASGKTSPVKLFAGGDRVASALERRAENGAGAIAFTPDGKQMAFTAGEDLYVMDRVLKEPVRVTTTPNREDNLVFSSDGRTLWFTSDVGGEVDVWRLECPREDGIWWLARSADFAPKQITDDRAVEDDLLLSPKGDRLALTRDNDLFVMNLDGSGQELVLDLWSGADFDWSPDGKWFALSTQDGDYNSDVWIAPVDRSRPPFNVSRHPDRDGSPRWSPDGKRLAFVSNRGGEESDIYYVNLTKEVDESTSRDRKLKEALEAMKKKTGARGGKPSGATAGGEPGRGRRGGEPTTDPADPARPDQPVASADGDAKAKDEKDDDEKKEKKPVEVTIDFDGLLDRMHRIAIGNSSERNLLWSPDGKKLAFDATVDNERGVFTVEFPDVGKPKRLARSGLAQAVWLEAPNEIVGLASGGGGDDGMPFRRRGGGGGAAPAAMNARGEIERFEFSSRQVRDWAALRQLAFDQGWRAMRDRFYDEAMNDRDWNAVREKFRPVAARCLGRAEFNDLMNMMLGELNASHMGHSGGDEPLPSADRPTWTPTTMHLGLRFERRAGKGLRVRNVIPGSPCSQARSRVEAGETLVAVDGVPIDEKVELDALLTMDEARDVELLVRAADGTERSVTVRPVPSVSGLLYDEWVEQNRRQVEELSKGTLGYLHIRGMNMQSFEQLEEDVYAAGHGKDGLIIDVRFNGGGSTADHVLTVLTQPVHAVTRSRGSEDGYPVDRKVYATWNKPIVLMCNEYSFSNAEILSHAVKQLGRGRLVGMRTGGGVISTGAQGLADGSMVRMPTRGWYLVSTGEDMELNGCLPDIALWNPPQGPDRQLEKAVEALREGVAKEAARPRPSPITAAAKRRLEADPDAAAAEAATKPAREGNEAKDPAPASTGTEPPSGQSGQGGSGNGTNGTNGNSGNSGSGR